MNILNKLTIKHLRLNPKRTLVTIIGVILSCALMVGIGLLFSTMRSNMLDSVILNNGSQHVKISNVSAAQIALLENQNQIKKVNMIEPLGFSQIENPVTEEKPYLYVSAFDSDLLGTLKVVEGRLPSNESELVISEELAHVIDNYTIGAHLKLPLGYRDVEGEKDYQNRPLYVDETAYPLVVTETREYTIVGIVSSHYTQISSQDMGYYTYTKLGNLSSNQNYKAYLTFKSTKNIYHKMEQLISLLNVQKPMIQEEDISYNSSLLMLYGQSRYSNILSSFMGLIVIILVLVSVGCIIVIYNSFAISVMERKKQFGLFSSIGATKFQLRHTVLYEGALIALIGIPLGILSGFLGIWVVVMIINKLIGSLFDVPLVFSAYPPFVLVPILFMLVVIFISAWLPARKASKITPIEAIRQNDDIKIKGKKLKTPYLIRKLFGTEGEIALKNMKRNKRKYRITVISLIISIVLFISFSAISEYGTYSTKEMFQTVDFDIAIRVHDEKEKQVQSFIQNLVNHPEVTDSGVFQIVDFHIKPILENMYHTDYQKHHSHIPYRTFYQNDEELFDLDFLRILVFDDIAYQKYLKQLGLSSAQPIFINQFHKIVYSSNSRKSYQGKLLKENVSFEIYETNTIHNLEHPTLSDLKHQTLSNLYETTVIPFGVYAYLDGTPTVIMNQQQVEDILAYRNDPETELMTEVYLKVNKDREINDLLKKAEDNDFSYYSYDNYKEALKMQRNILLAIQILLYGFISLVTLIGVTSVFNTIHTSIALRRKEFAMLRSVGLTPKGFNRMLRLESLFFGLKSLLFGIPISLGITLLIHSSLSGAVSFVSIIFPWKSILIAILGVFIIVGLSMTYATHKMKRENILEAIREENI